MSSVDVSRRLFEAVAEADPDLALRMSATKWGTAPHQQWRCADGWIVGYTTGRIEYARHEPYNGKFAAFAYRPIGKGARTGKASEWEMDYFRAFAKRKTARARAEALYYQHQDKAKARA